MALQASGIADLVATTLNDYGRMNWTDLASAYQNCDFTGKLVKKSKMVLEEGGKEFQWDVMTDNNGSARFVGLYASDLVNVPDVMIQGSMGYCHMTWNFAIDAHEITMNSGPAKIVDLVLSRRLAAKLSAIEVMERRMWRAPASTDTENPKGVPYWIVKSNTAATYANNDGFNGLVPSGFTTVAGINPTTYPRWRNYATQYTDLTKADFVRKIRRALHKTEFKALVSEMPTFNTGDDVMICTNYTALAQLEELAESQNDNLGSDIASQDGKVMIRRIVVNPVPELENDTTNPFYGINCGEFKLAVLKGWWDKVTKIENQPGQHNVAVTHYDSSFQPHTRNRRRHFVLATDTTMPA